RRRLIGRTETLKQAMDEQPTHERILYSNINRGGRLERKARSLPAGAPAAWTEPEREIPVYAHCDVLVVGGGPSGTAAAVAAARTGADVLLLERYNHLGGLSTGGLVIWIDRMTDWSGKHVIQGYARDFIDRMPPEGIAGPAKDDWGSRDPLKAGYWGQRTSAFHGVVCWAPTL